MAKRIPAPQVFKKKMAKTANTLAPPTLLTQIQVSDLLGWKNISITPMICLANVFLFKSQTFEKGKNNSCTTQVFDLKNGEITFMQTMFYVR